MIKFSISCWIILVFPSLAFSQAVVEELKFEGYPTTFIHYADGVSSPISKVVRGEATKIPLTTKQKSDYKFPINENLLVPDDLEDFEKHSGVTAEFNKLNKSEKTVIKANAKNAAAVMLSLTKTKAEVLKTLNNYLEELNTDLSTRKYSDGDSQDLAVKTKYNHQKLAYDVGRELYMQAKVRFSNNEFADQTISNFCADESQFDYFLCKNMYLNVNNAHWSHFNRFRVLAGHISDLINLAFNDKYKAELKDEVLHKLIKSNSSLRDTYYAVFTL